MRMNSVIFGLLALGVALPATANPAYFEAYRQQLAQEIEMLDWNLRHSSVAPTLEPQVQGLSLSRIDAARKALAAGDTRLAEDLAAEAALPLTTVAIRGPLDSHPEKSRYFREIRHALLSITESAERIAREEGRPGDYRSETLVAIARAEHDLKAGDVERAFAAIGARYDEISRIAADLRRGGNLYVRAPEWKDERQFQDVIRRIDDRRFLTEQLIVEAQAIGVDQTPLREALAIASASLAQANAYAAQQRWEKAYQAMELAFAEIEDRWRMVGLDW